MAAAPRTPRTPKNARARVPRNWAPRFLEAFEETHLVSEACKRAGIGRTFAYERRSEGGDFALAWGELEERSTELLEREAYRRAAVGVDKPVYHQGQRVDTVKEYSDVLLIFLLKARRPDTYREQHKIEHSGPDGGPIAAETTIVDKRKRSDAARQYLATIAED